MRSRRPPALTSRATADGEEVREVPPQVPFNELGLSDTMLATIAGMGFTMATPIQSVAIGPALAGHDITGQAHTGSGKTAAFGVPMVERLDPQGPAAQGLILCPTRELALQVHEEMTQLCAGHGLRSLAVYGGDSMTRQLDEIRRGAHIIVATPGRLADHLQRRSLSLAKTKMIVLDEADRMLDMGFAPDVEKILRQSPESRQTLLFSATMPEWVKRLAARHMRDPVNLSISGRPEIAAGMRQLYLQTPWAEKVDALTRVLDQPDVTMALVFVETKRTADMLHAQLSRRGYDIGVLHGDLSQKERDRSMSDFSAINVKYLIATNVAARGLDIDDISHVINYDVPTTPEEYLHRVGRTARAGRTGVAITLITPSEILKLRDVERHANTRIDPARLTDFPAREPSPPALAVSV